MPDRVIRGAVLSGIKRAGPVEPGLRSRIEQIAGDIMARVDAGGHLPGAGVYREVSGWLSSGEG